jgi:hypothetical protein
MIDKALTFLVSELNALLIPSHGTGELPVVLSNLAEPDGSVPMKISNKIVLTITNIERETAALNQDVAGRPQPAGVLRVNAPLNLNIYLLLSASAADYLVALQLLSSALAVLQSRPVFTPQNSSGFPAGLERLTLEIVNLSVQDLQNLWASTGAKYLPSVYLKVRMVTIQGAWVVERVPQVSGTDTRV